MRHLVFAAALACTALTLPAPARADPISASILAALGTQTATALAITVVTTVLTTAASILATKLLTPGQKRQDRQASIVQLSIGETAREALFGEVGTGGSLAHGFNYGGVNGTDWEVLQIVVADHRCHSLTGFYVADVYVPFTGDGPVAGYNGQLEVYWREGTEDQVMPSVVTTYGNRTANDNLAGCAVIVVAYKADDPKAKNPIWTAGRPQFVWVVKGKHCYIPRLDGTVEGGSGPHRWDDPDTWEWTDNVIDCRYNWQRGVYACDRIGEPGMLLVGRGLSAIEAPPERTIAAANVCDERVELKAGGTEKRYRCNAVVKADEDFIATEEMFAAACAGVIVQRDGGVEIEPGAAKSVVAELTDDDFIVGEKRGFNRFKSAPQRFNSIIPRYIEPAQKWADHAAPIRRDLNDIMADGRPREDTLSLIGVTSGTQAQRCGEIKRRLSRLERTGNGVLGPRFAFLEEGDWIGWTSLRHLKGARAVFRITQYSRGANWRNSIAFEEISADCYDWNAAVDEMVDSSVAEQQATPPADVDPDDVDWGLTTAVLDGTQQPVLRVAGGAATSSVAAVIIEYRVDDGSDPQAATDWIGTGDSAAEVGAVQRDIAGVALGMPYVASVRYVFYAGGISGRLILGPVTISLDALPPSPADMLTVDAGTGSADVSWRNPASGNFGYVKVRRGTTAVFASSTEVTGPIVGGLGQLMSFTDTVAAGTYFWWVVAYSVADIAAVATGPESAAVA